MDADRLNLVHPTAQIGRSAVLHAGVRIGPYCCVGDGVELGEGVVLGDGVHVGGMNPFVDDDQTQITVGAGSQIASHAVLSGRIVLGAGVKLGTFVAIHGPARIGNRTEIHAGAVIGGPGQFPGRHRYDGEVSIGEDVVVREQCCITKPVLTERTSIGDHSYLMARTQVDHDCVLASHVKTAAGVTLGGSVHVGTHAYLGMNAVVHQGVHVGAGTMIGMNGVVLRHVPPFATLVNRRFTKLNRRGLELRGATDSDLLAIETRYSHLAARSAGAEANPWVRMIDTFYDEIGDAAACAPEFTAPG